MAFPFRMTFTGLCALVPNTNGTEGRVLLVDASTATGPLHSHVPWLRYRGRKHSLAGAEVMLHLTNPQPPTLQIFSPVLPSPGGRHLPTPQTAEEYATFWVADLEKTGAVLKAESLSGNRPPFIAARIKLTAGHLGSSRLIEKQDNQSVVSYWPWSLRNGAGTPIPDFDRAMAAQFSLNATIDGGQITISNGPTLILQPSAGEASVEIGNTCNCVDTGGPLEDFAWFYALSTVNLDYLPVKGGAGVSDTMCPPARFAPNPAA